MTQGSAGAVRLARAALTRLIEPGDLPGLALIRALGPQDALALISGRERSHPGVEQEVSALLSEQAVTVWPGLAQVMDRWRPRLAGTDAARDLYMVSKMSGRLLIPEDPQWPRSLDDLELGAPMALWVRGGEWPIPEQQLSIALVGSRDNTSYGANVAGEMASSLVQRGFTVISGGAYGIDAHAHRGALAAARDSLPTAPPTIAVMAGGLDRYYPSGNEELLRTVAAQGLLLAEVPPGTNPTRYRFLQRNRLIAALSQVTVVVEARWRSGALNTAHHAEQLSRMVGAVPGSVYSANSAGCHRLLKEGAAVCVSDAADVAELAGSPGEHLVVAPETEPAIHDGLGTSDLLLLDALPLRSATSVDKLCVVAGLSAPTVLAGLGRLEVLGLAERQARGWKRRNR